MSCARAALMRLRVLILLLPAAAAACAEGPSTAGSLRPEQQQCQKWGYQPDDPTCLALFRRIPP